MYRDNKYRNDFFRIVVRIILCFLIIILTLKLVSIIIINNSKNKIDSTLNDNLVKIDNVAKKYFTEEKLPKETGESSTIYLEQLIKEKRIKKIKDSNGSECNSKLSYIKAIRLDNEYQIKSFLYCKDDQDYINSFIKIEKDDKEKNKDIIKVETTTKARVTSKKKKNTQKVTNTSKKRYSVSYNVNGGEYIEDKYYIGTYKAENIVPIRNGYNFIGWFYHGEKFDFSQELNSDIVLTAKWSK